MTEASSGIGTATKASTHYLRIVPSRGWVGLRLGELWDYRELLFFLALRDGEADRYAYRLESSAIR